MSNDHSVFSFELTESLYFERGQEVEEVIGISLDPEISIQSFSEYISIRGIVELRGQYRKVLPLNEVEDEPTYFDDYHSKRYMESVVDLNDGNTEFTHRFPVEITVPTYRVNDLDDITVSIASFDYEMPDQNHLRLNSIIEIGGINEQAEQVEADTLITDRGFDMDETFEFEIKKQKEAESTDEVDIHDEGEIVQKDYIPTVSSETDLHESDEKGRWKKKKTQTIAEFFNPDVYEESIADFESHDPSSTIYDEDMPSSSRESSDSEEISSESGNRYFMRDMFRDEEVNYTKMRLCIVQEKDTLESIAERYRTTSMHLINQNRLADDNVNPGQLLYVPYKKKE